MSAAGPVRAVRIDEVNAVRAKNGRPGDPAGGMVPWPGHLIATENDQVPDDYASGPNHPTESIWKCGFQVG